METERLSLLIKAIHDQYGHFVGDMVLKEAGKLMKNEIRGIDLVARVGGEEFGIILPETHLQNAVFIAQRLRLKCTNAA
jgi:diguanylate cyclase (GGDEF)-like protein